MQTISRFPKLILLGVVSLGLGAAAIYAIPALATSFGDDVTVSKRLILNSSNAGLLNPDQFQIFSGDTPLVRLHQDTTGIYPEQIWDLYGNETAMRFLDVTGGNKIPFSVYAGAPNWSLVVDSSGNVGIGTTNPLSKLDIVEPTAANVSMGLIGRGGNSLKSNIFFGVKNSGGGNVGASIGSNGALGGGLSLAGDTGGSGNPDVYISPAGNVGIGTTGPANKLTVAVSGNATLNTPAAYMSVFNSNDAVNTQYYGIAFTNSNTPEGATQKPQALISAYASGGSWLANWAADLVFSTASGGASAAPTEKVRILNNGNVGIGTTNPGSKLEINGSVRVAPTGAPTSPTRGTIYFDAASNHFFGFNGVWKQLDN